MVRSIASTIHSWLSQGGSIGSSRRGTLVFGLTLLERAVKPALPSLGLATLLITWLVSEICLFPLFLLRASTRIIFGFSVWFVRAMASYVSICTSWSTAIALFLRLPMIVFEYLDWAVHTVLSLGRLKATTQWIRFVRHVRQ